MDFNSINSLTDILNYIEDVKEQSNQTQTFMSDEKVKFALESVNALSYTEAGLMLKTLATHLRDFHDHVVCDEDEQNDKEPWIVDLIRLENVCKILEDFG